MKDYRIQHCPPDRQAVDNKEAVLLHEIANGLVAPADYLTRILDYEPTSGYMTVHDVKRQTVDIIQHQNQPDKPITIYRGTPEPMLHTGDWITLSPKYALMYAYGNDGYDVNSKVYQATVLARDIVWAGDTIWEFGYLGPDIPMTQVKEKALCHF